MHLGKKNLQELKKNKISIKDLNDRYFIDSQAKVEAENILRLLNGDICSFKEIVDKFKSIKDRCTDSYLYDLLKNKELFEELIQNNKLNKDDLEYLLNEIDNIYELHRLCENAPLIKHILNEFVLDKKLVDKFNTMIENDWWCKRVSIHTIFDRIEHENKDNKEVLKLIELNKKVYLLSTFDLNEEQRLELIELIKNNEITQNRLIQIIENDLESNFDFESLIQYLKKQEKKNLINV